MITAWMVYGILISTLVAVAALALEHVSRMYRWTTRWTWVGALLAPVLIAVIVAGMTDGSLHEFTSTPSPTAVHAAQLAAPGAGMPSLSIARDITRGDSPDMDTF